MGHLMTRVPLSDFAGRVAHFLSTIGGAVSGLILVMPEQGADFIVLPVGHYRRLVEDASRWKSLCIAAEQGRPSPFPDIALLGVPPRSREVTP